jgi:hypothetical protein
MLPRFARSLAMQFDRRLKMKSFAFFLCLFLASQVFAQQIISKQQAEQIARSDVDLPPLTFDAGFRLTVYTPSTWVRHEADKTPGQRSFFVADVSMLSPLLRVYASPNLETNINRLCESVQRVLLKDASRQTVIQPGHVESFVESDYLTTDPYGYSRGPTTSCTGLIAHFSLDQVRQVHGGDGEEEFYITVVGDSYEQDFKVKRKDFEYLP